MLHHIYPKDNLTNGVSVYGRQIDELLEGAALPEGEIWHFELSYTGTDELWAAEAVRRGHPGAAYVVTLHDPPVVCGKPFNRYVRSTSFGAKVVRKLLDLTVGRWLVRRVVRGAARVIVSNGLAKPVVVAKFGLEPARVVISPLLPSLPAPAQFGMPQGPLQLLFFGILTPRKGVEDLIRAFAQVKAADGVRLTVFGGTRPDNPGYAEGLKKLAADLRVSERITFTGYGDDAAMARALLAAHVVVLPFHEVNVVHASGPLTTAMAYGRAVVASDLPITHDELGSGEYGRLFPPHDVAALAGILQGLIDNPAEAEKLGRAAYGHVQSQHSPDIIRQQLLEVYRSL